METHAKHKPVVVSDNYEKVDGRLTQNTDTKRLSLGLAHLDDKGREAITAMVLSDAGEEKWSQESGELPLHRVLDLSILICRSLAHFREAYRYEHYYDPKEPVLDRIGLQGNAMTVAICTDNEEINDDIKRFSQALSVDDEMISERLRVLSKILKDMAH